MSRLVTLLAVLSEATARCLWRGTGEPFFPAVHQDFLPGSQRSLWAPGILVGPFQEWGK